MPMTYVLPEEFAREHAQRLRDLASISLLHELEGGDEADWRDITRTLEAFAVDFESAGIWTTVSSETQAEH